MKHNSLLWIFAVLTLSLAQNDQFFVSRQQFALDLFKNTQMGSNMLISPLSIDFVLNLLLLGSTKETNRDLKIGLEYPKSFSAKTIASNLEMWSKAVKMINGAELATKIYVNQSVAVKNSYKLSIRKTLNSDLEKIAFVKSKFATDKINKWIAIKTNDLIQNMIKDGIIDRKTLMVLINCIYFSGKWKDQFYPSMKLFENFTAIDGSKTNIEFMYQEASLPFSSNINEFKGASAVSLAYENSTASMLIVLPPNNIEFLLWLSSIKQINWTAVDDSLKPQDVILKIPKFNIEFDKDMKSDLEIMGFRSIFNERVNLDKMFSSQPAKIKNLLHKTMIKIDEVGTVAVGASIVIGVDSMPFKQWNFTANRPFLFFIRSGPTIMFVGQYVQ